MDELPKCFQFCNYTCSLESHYICLQPFMSFAKSNFQQFEWQLPHKCLKASYSLCKQEYSTSICKPQISSMKFQRWLVLLKSQFLLSLLILFLAAGKHYGMSNGAVNINICLPSLAYYTVIVTAMFIWVAYICTTVQSASPAIRNKDKSNIF